MSVSGPNRLIEYLSRKRQTTAWFSPLSGNGYGVVKNLDRHPLSHVKIKKGDVAEELDQEAWSTK